MSLFASPPSDAQLAGRDPSLIDSQRLERPVHGAVVEALMALKRDAEEAGFDLALASGYRDYARQLQIWNGKADGSRPLLDGECRPLDAAQLDPGERLHAILRWSALPGASRHHWGTDIDVYDRAALAPGTAVELVAAEVADDGPFGPLHRWLDERIAEDASHGFFRPYAEERGGVAPERWHLSYAPLAARYQAVLTPARLFGLVDSDGLQLRDEVRRQWPALYDRYIEVPPASYPAQWEDLIMTLRRGAGR